MRKIEKNGVVYTQTIRKSIAYLLPMALILLFIIWVGYSFWSEGKMSTWNNTDYPETNIMISDMVNCNSCVITDNTLELTGTDPYILFAPGGVLVRDVNVDFLENYDKSYKIYYAPNDILSEDYVGKEWIARNDEVFLIDSKINLLRVDFEGTEVGEKYTIKKDSICLNSNEDKNMYMEENIKPCLAYAIVLIVIVGAYMTLLLHKKHYIAAAVVYIYFLMIERIWLRIPLSNADVLTQVAMTMVCIGGGVLWNIFANPIELRGQT